jgi:hypothetical protein
MQVVRAQATFPHRRGPRGIYRRDNTVSTWGIIFDCLGCATALTYVADKHTTGKAHPVRWKLQVGMTQPYEFFLTSHSLTALFGPFNLVHNAHFQLSEARIFPFVFRLASICKAATERALQVVTATLRATAHLLQTHHCSAHLLSEKHRFLAERRQPSWTRCCNNSVVNELGRFLRGDEGFWPCC